MILVCPKYEPHGAANIFDLSLQRCYTGVFRVARNPRRVKPTTRNIISSRHPYDGRVVCLPIRLGRVRS